jgi:hypothetical protein
MTAYGFVMYDFHIDIVDSIDANATTLYAFSYTPFSPFSPSSLHDIYSLNSFGLILDTVIGL